MQTYSTLVSVLNVRLSGTIFNKNLEKEVSTYFPLTIARLTSNLGKSWLKQKSPGLNLDWFRDVKSLLMEKKMFCTTTFQGFSNILEEWKLAFSKKFVIIRKQSVICY